jgi:hypothetical protein
VRTDAGARAGLGVFRVPVGCGDAWGHDGAVPGYLTYVLTSKDGSHIVVVAATGDSSLVDNALKSIATGDRLGA